MILNSHNDFTIDDSIELFNEAKKLGFKFYLTKFSIYKKVVIYHPDFNNGIEYDATKIESFPLFTNVLFRTGQIAKNYTEKEITTLDDFLNYATNLDTRFITHGAGQVFANLYNKAINERKPYLLKHITYYIHNYKDYNDLSDVFSNIDNLTIKEAKKIWNSISKKDFKFRDHSSDETAIADFLENIYSHFDFDFAHQFVKHIAINRSSQINATVNFSLNFRNFLIQHYTKNDKEELLNDFSKYIQNIQFFEENKNNDYMNTSEPVTIKQNINFKLLSQNLLVDSWNSNTLVNWYKMFVYALSKNNLFENYELSFKNSTNNLNEKDEDITSVLFLIDPNKDEFDIQKLNIVTKKYFETLKENHEYANLLESNPKEANKKFAFVNVILSKILLDLNLKKKSAPNRSADKVNKI